jgi:rhamnogalacturonan endolyase
VQRGRQSTPTRSADLTGDWREEVVWRETDSSALRLYTTTDVTTRRIYTLMHDAQYRVAVSWQNGAYNQPPHTSFAIGSGMADPPIPNITIR